MRRREFIATGRVACQHDVGVLWFLVSFSRATLDDQENLL
jgi:hypothetical protein